MQTTPMKAPRSFRPPETEILTQLSITEPDGVALLMDQSLGSLPDLGWGSISTDELIKPEAFQTTVAGALVEYVPAVQLSGICPGCGGTKLFLGMTRQQRWFGLREGFADVIHCQLCGAFSKLQGGVALMVVYYGQGLNQMQWLGRDTNVREYMDKLGRPLTEVLEQPNHLREDE